MNKSLDFFLRAMGYHWKVSNRRNWYDRYFIFEVTTALYESLAVFMLAKDPTQSNACSQQSWSLAGFLSRAIYVEVNWGFVCLVWLGTPGEPLTQNYTFHSLPSTLKPHSICFFFLCDMFVWFWYQSDGGLVECVWECSSLCYVLEEFEKDKR